LVRGLQTTPWLNEFWFLGLPSAVISYVLLKRIDNAKPIPAEAISFAIFTTVIAVFLVTWALLWLTTEGVELLPPIMSDPVHPQLAWHFLPLVLLSITAMALLWSRRQSVLDLWLLVMLEAWMLNALMFNRLVIRWSVFWYCGRVFAALATSVILLFLLSETTVLYWRLARSNMMLQRERNNKLMNFEAVIASIAHQVRQPLYAIAANGRTAQEILGHTPPDLAEVGAALEDIVADSYRASEVFDSLRTLFGKVDQEAQSIDVNEIVVGVLQSLRDDLENHGVATQPELTSELPCVRGHGGQLREVIFNLIYNAIEAMGATMDQTRLLRVRTELRGSDAVAVTVHDSGPGIDPKQMDSIFDAFVTTKAHGTGLGLAICRNIIERHGGRLTASSDARNGASFQFVLPIKASDKASG
jgi:signal transduction histidine kinase